MLETGCSRARGYGVAVLSVAIVTALRLAAHPLIGTHARFLTFILAVMVSSWYGGLRPGLLATALSAILGVFLFPEPGNGATAIVDRYALIELAFFAVIGVVISILNDVLKSEVAERRHAEQGSRAQARALTDVIESLAHEHDLERLQGLVLAAMVNQLNADGGALWAHDTETGEFKVVLDCQNGQVTTLETPGRTLADRESAGREFTDWKELKATALRGDCLQVPNVENDPRLPERLRRPLGKMGIKSILIVPMLIQDHLVGLCTVRNNRVTKYEPNQIQLAKALAHQATLAIQMSGLASQAKQTAVVEERNRMAREIHDTLAQAFTGVLLQLGAAERLQAEEPGRGQEHIGKARDAARDGLEEARRSVHALRPQALEETDLAAALRRMAEQSNTGQGAQIQFLLHGSPRPLPPDVADNLLRIGQEALTNALRHAQANEIRTELTFADEELHLCVKDDGCGFATDDGLPRKGYGLSGMHERAGIIGAHLAVTGGPGSGTCVELAWRFQTSEPDRSDI